MLSAGNVNDASEFFDKNSCNCLMYRSDDDTSAESFNCFAFLGVLDVFPPKTLHICKMKEETNEISEMKTVLRIYLQ